MGDEGEGLLLYYPLKFTAFTSTLIIFNLIFKTTIYIHSSDFNIALYLETRQYYPLLKKIYKTRWIPQNLYIDLFTRMYDIYICI